VSFEYSCAQESLHRHQFHPTILTFITVPDLLSPYKMAEEQNSSAGTCGTHSHSSAQQLTKSSSMACCRRRPDPRNPRHRPTSLTLPATQKRCQRSHQDPEQRNLRDNNPRRRHFTARNPATPPPPLRGQKHAVRLCPQQDSAWKSVWCVEGGYRDEHYD
jgi:hypothetical protein